MRTKIEMFNSNKQCSETDKKIRWIGGRKYRKKDADIERKIQTQKERYRHRKKDTDIERKIQTQKERQTDRKLE